MAGTAIPLGCGEGGAMHWGLITIVVLVGLLLVVKRLPSHEPRPGFVKWRNRFFILVGVCLLMIVVREKYEMHVDRDNPVNLPIVAEKYVWPVGCEERNYVKGDPISSNCMSKKYYMRSGLKYKFNGYIEYVNKTPNYYYRVQNDAFSINCFFSGCFISIVHKNVFKVNTDA